MISKILTALTLVKRYLTSSLMALGLRTTEITKVVRHSRDLPLTTSVIGTIYLNVACLISLRNRMGDPTWSGGGMHSRRLCDSTNRFMTLIILLILPMRSMITSCSSNKMMSSSIRNANLLNKRKITALDLQGLSVSGASIQDLASKRFRLLSLDV